MTFFCLKQTKFIVCILLERKMLWYKKVKKYKKFVLTNTADRVIIQLNKYSTIRIGNKGLNKDYGRKRNYLLVRDNT